VEVEVEAAGVEGTAGLGAGAAFGYTKSDGVELGEHYWTDLADHTYDEAFLFNLVGFHSVGVSQNLSCTTSVCYKSTKTIFFLPA
jgi:hypothetical protein